MSFCKLRCMRGAQTAARMPTCSGTIQRHPFVGSNILDSPAGRSIAYGGDGYSLGWYARWKENPHRLIPVVALMNVFAAERLVKLLQVLKGLSSLVANMQLGNKGPILAQAEVVRGFRKALVDTDDLCIELGLIVSHTRIRDLLGWLDHENATVLNMNIFQEADGVLTLIGNELQSQKCFILSREKA